jgi:hypothetical protein
LILLLDMGGGGTLDALSRLSGSLVREEMDNPLKKCDAIVKSQVVYAEKKTAQALWTCAVIAA